MKMFNLGVDHPKNDWCVIWRTGNTESFEWHRSDPMSREAADSAREAFLRDGYRAMTERHGRSVAIGLPSTWAATAWETAEDKKAEAAKAA